MSSNMEFKTLAGLQPVQIEDRTVKGFASVFGNVDDGSDITHPGAFTKTIKESLARVRFLWQHDTEAPPTAQIKSLYEAKRDELPAEVKSKYPDAMGGLLVEREYLDTPRGNEILAGYKAGICFEMSFGYETIKSDFSTVGDTRARNLRELKLYECSDVHWGMNPATRGAKGAGGVNGTKGTMLWDALWHVRSGQDLAALLQAGSALDSDQINQISGIMQLLSSVLARANEICEQQAQADYDSSYGTMAANYLDLITRGMGWLKYLPMQTAPAIDRAQINKLTAALSSLVAAEPGTPLTAKNRMQLAQAKLRILELESSDPHGQHGTGILNARR